MIALAVTRRSREDGVSISAQDTLNLSPGVAATRKPRMYKASANTMLPTSIIGSLPRPSWYSAVLGNQSFLEAMVNSRYREQYEDTVSVFLRAQEMAGLDICTDGDAHYDEQVAGMSWQSYPLTHMAGIAATPEPPAYNVG